MIRLSLRHLFLCVLLVTSSWSFAADTSDNNNQKLNKKSNVTHRNYNKPIDSQFGNLLITVKLASEAEMADSNYEQWLEFLPAGSGAAAYSAFIPDPRMILSAIILLPGAMIGYNHDKNIYDTVKNALTTYQLTQTVSERLHKRLNLASNENVSQEGLLQIRIHAYGLKGSSLTQYCLPFYAEVIRNVDPDFEQKIEVKISKSSDLKNMPPPQCANLERFSEKDGQLVKDSLAIYAEVLAVIASRLVLQSGTK